MEHRMLYWGNKCSQRRRRLITFALTLVLGIIAHGSTSHAGDDPARIGRWSAIMKWPGPSEHAYLLPSGKVMINPGEGALNLWDPVSGKFLLPGDLPFRYQAPPYRYDCAGHAFLPDGRLLIAGGDRANWGVPFAITYNPFNGTWSRLPDMNDGRYYPTVLTLASGDVLALSGNTKLPSATEFLVNKLPQVFQAATGKWRDLTGALMSLYYYPYSFVAPNGKVFVAGPGTDSKYLDTSGEGAWSTVAVPQHVGRYFGSAVQYDDGKILMMGGDNPPLATAEVIDLTVPIPKWRGVGSMAYPRRVFDATILPNGEVLVTGGSSGFGDDPSNSAMATEVWDPNTETWTVLASASVHRGMHSTALLLPDGRVLKMSGNYSPRTAQIFSPPYLFQGPQPRISAAPARVTYGQEFMIGTPDGADISQVTLLRLGAVTHDYNMSQRINKLIFWQTRDGITAKAPPNGALCPPGHYMLFILNGRGVPSVAKIIQVVNPAEANLQPDTLPFSSRLRGR